MRALQYTSVAGPVHVVDLPVPAPEQDGALISVTRTGLCRSDWHGWQGHDSDTVLPCVPGHEFTGTVVEAPADPGLVGSRVVVPFVMACGRCPECVRGSAQICRAQRQPGFTDPGSFAEFVAVPAAAVNVVPLPDEVTDDAAAALGCRVATAWRALTAVAQVEPGESVLILGAGGVGLAAVQIAQALGATPIATDISAHALSIAESLGAQTVSLTPHDSEEEIAGQVRTAYPEGVDVSVDALGSPALAAAGVLALRRGGRHVQVGLLDAPRTPLPLGRIIAHEIALLGSHGMAASDYPALLDAVAAGRLDPAALVTATLDLAQAATALVTMTDPGAPRGIRLIDPTR